MCMQNVNSTLNVEAINEMNERITKKSEDGSGANIIPVDQNYHAKIVLSYMSSIINGKSNFFDQHKKLYIQLRLTDKDGEDCMILENFNTELSLDPKSGYHKLSFVDFKVDNRVFVKDLDVSNIRRDVTHYISILIKTNIQNQKWIIQSAIPLRFEFNEK